MDAKPEISEGQHDLPKMAILDTARGREGAKEIDGCLMVVPRRKTVDNEIEFWAVGANQGNGLQMAGRFLHGEEQGQLLAANIECAQHLNGKVPVEIAWGAQAALRDISLRYPVPKHAIYLDATDESEVPALSLSDLFVCSTNGGIELHSASLDRFLNLNLTTAMNWRLMGDNLAFWLLGLIHARCFCGIICRQS